MSETNMMEKAKKPDMTTVSGALQHPSINNRIESMLGKRAPQFCSALIQVSKSNNLLAKAEPMTVIGAAMTAASMDLSIDPNLGFAHIVPYGKQAQFQMGYKGFIQLGLRTGQYAAMNDFKVNKEAFVSFNPVTGELKIDEEKLNEDGEIVGYGFYFRLVNGFEKTVYWPKEKVEAHAKQFSQSYRKGFGPWKDNFHAMALKTVIKLTLGKYGILSTEMQMAVTRDQAVIVDDGEHQEVYVDNATTSGPVYDEPALGDDKDGEKKEEAPAAEDNGQQGETSETKPEETVDLTPVKDMDKSALTAELGVHASKPYYEHVVKGHLPDDADVTEITKLPASALRDVVTDLRNTAEEQA